MMPPSCRSTVPLCASCMGIGQLLTFVEPYDYAGKVLGCVIVLALLWPVCEGFARTRFRYHATRTKKEKDPGDSGSLRPRPYAILYDRIHENKIY